MSLKLNHRNNDKLLDTSNEKAANNWHQLLNLQTEVFFPYEVSLLYDCYEWLNAKSVLDVGCGNGYFIKQVVNQFPEKEVTAIDISGELIEIAQNMNGHSNIKYMQKDFLTFQSEKKYDVIVMRLIVQHLSNFPNILKHASGLLRPGGSMIILEADHGSMFNAPSIPRLLELLNALDENSKNNKTNRCEVHKLSEVAKKTREWMLNEEIVTKVPFIKVKNNSDLMKIYNLWLDILEQNTLLRDHIPQVRNEIRNWSNLQNNYAELGIRFIHLIVK